MEMLANNQDKKYWSYGTQLTKDNCYSNDFVQNIANFKSVCFPDTRKLVFSLEQFVSYTLISITETLYFFPT